MIRYHSLYPYHAENDYQYFMNDKDCDMIKHLKEFNKYDLYTKNNDLFISKPDSHSNQYKNIPESALIPENLKKYYDDLITKFIPNSYLIF